MIVLEVVGLAGTAAISACFYFIRERLALFWVACLGVVAVCGAVIWTRTEAVALWPTVLLTAGFLLNALGLSIVRVMLQRSVSLHMLASCSSDGDEPVASAEIATRLKDAERFGLVHRAAPNRRYALTPLGRIIAALMGPLYRLTGVDG